MSYTTAQHIPWRQASPRQVVYATSEKPHLIGCPGLPIADLVSLGAIPGDDPTDRVVTGEIPVRFV